MPTTTNTKMILRMLPVAWVYVVPESGAPTLLWEFDNLASGNVRMIRPGNEEGAEYLDKTRGDGALIRHTKFNLHISGVDETDITPADQGSDVSNRGSMSFTTNEAPIGATNFTSFLSEIQANYDNKLLIVMPTGLSHEGTLTGTPDGFAAMVGKISNDIDWALSESMGSVQIDFVSYATANDFSAAPTFGAITWKGKAIDIDGPTLTGSESDLSAGKVVLI